MHRLTGTRLSSPLSIPALAVVLAIAAWMAAPAPAMAQFFGFGPRYYAPFPYYFPPPAYYPYYPPPPAYYPPPAPTYGAPPPAAGALAEPAALGAPGAAAPGVPQPGAAITYTDRPAFRNATGQTCREYRGANGGLGSACQDASGQWRDAN